MIKIGMMIGDRYEILEKIGTGGMSDVYKAKCHKLNRYVAIKVLKQEFSENANFVSKFRIEAQAAAGLMHPNIVNVYDVGEENGIYYIVMELVEGITLKKYIEKKARLSYKEAISIAIQVSMGIEAAHKNHIIHRDIKPQNIMISKDGKVKVTDFGIAKAATSNTITSNVMGSVHYTSPEQARGGYSDERSDIYSLGITLFEMLTGRVPFNGETTVAIAIKHIQEEMPSPKEYVPEIPVSVEQIVLKCCQKSPDRRYQSMAELIADLKQCLLTPEEDFVSVAGPDTEGSTRAVSEQDLSAIKKQAGRRAMQGAGGSDSQSREESFGQIEDSRRTENWSADEVEEGWNNVRKQYRGRNISSVNGGNGYEQGTGEGYGDNGAGYEREGYAPEDYEQEDYGYQESGSQSYQGSYEENAYEGQTGRTGQISQDRGNYGPQDGRTGRIPREKIDTDTMRLRRDTQRLYGEKGFEEEEEEFEDDNRMEKVTTVLAIVAGVLVCGIIIFLLVKVFDVFGNSMEERKSPIVAESGESKAQESQLSSSAAQVVKKLVTMPDVQNWNVEEARATLERMNLYVEVEYEETEDVDEDIVISASKEPGTEVEEESTVVLTVSSGAQGKEVPETTGKTFEDASTTLNNAGFQISRQDMYSESVAEGIVMGQNPSGGTKAPEGSTITVTVSIGADHSKVKVPNVIGMSEEDGMNAMKNAGLVVSSVSQVNNSQVPAGQICYQSYSRDSYVDEGTTIEIRISLGAATYKYNGTIEAPSTAEAPDYVAGTEVSLVLTTDDGMTLLNTKTSSFPQTVNYYGLKASAGTLTLTYSVTTEGSSVTDPVTGETVTTPGTTQQKSFSRRVEFTQE